MSMDRDLNAARNLVALVAGSAGGASSPSCGATQNEPAGNPRKTSHAGREYRHGKPLRAMPREQSRDCFRICATAQTREQRQDGAVTAAAAPTQRRRCIGSMEVLLASLIALALSAGAMSAFIAGNANVSVAATVFCGVFVQALPFLVLGVVISGLIAAFVSADRLASWLHRRPAMAVALAGVGGAALPGCECGVGAGRAATLRSGRLGRGRADVHAVRARHQPGRAGGHSGGLPRPAGHGPGPLRGLAGHRDHDGTALAALGSRRMGDPSAADAARHRRVPLDDLHRGGPPRLPAGRLLPGARCRGRRRIAGRRAGLGVRASRRTPRRRRADHGPARRRAGALLRGRRVRRRQPDDAAAAAAAGVSRRGAGRRRQAVGDAGRAVRPAIRGPLRAGDVHRRHDRRDHRRSGVLWAVRDEPRHAEHARFCSSG